MKIIQVNFLNKRFHKTNWKCYFIMFSLKSNNKVDKIADLMRKIAVAFSLYISKL
jgi:hypothetical protein